MWLRLVVTQCCNALTLRGNDARCRPAVAASDCCEFPAKNNLMARFLEGFYLVFKLHPRTFLSTCQLHALLGFSSAQRDSASGLTTRLCIGLSTGLSRGTQECRREDC